MLKPNDTAPFDLLAWLEGTTYAEGVFENRKGLISRRFTVVMTGVAEANGLRLTEHFAFADGERQERVWHLTRGTGNSFTGRAGDSVSEAQGRCEPGVAYLQSELSIRRGRRDISMRFDDAFYPVGPDALLNRSTVTKWGLRLGQVLILFRKGAQRSP